jgi:MFS family permease
MKNKIWTKDFTFLMIGLLFVSCANYFFASSIAVYAQLISSSAAYAGILTASFYFGSVGMRLVNGTLVQKYGSKPLMLAGALLCFAACFAHNIAGAVSVLVIFRVLHGMGYSIFSTASGTAASYLVPRERLSEGMGYYTIGNVLAMAAGPSVALAIVSKGTVSEFHCLFTTAALICAFAFVLVLFMRVDGEQEKKRHAANSRENICSKAESDRTAQSVHERQLPKTFLGFEKGVISPSIISFMMSCSYSPVIVYLAAYGIEKGWTNVGFAFTMYAAGLLLSRLVAGRMSDKYGPDCIMYPAYACGIISLLMISFCSSIIVLYTAMVVLGLCIGAYNPQINVFCIERCTEERRGTATAAFNGASDLGLAVGSSLSGILIGVIGYSRTYLAGACLCLCTVFVYTFTLSNRSRR